MTFEEANLSYYDAIKYVTEESDRSSEHYFELMAKKEKAFHAFVDIKEKNCNRCKHKKTCIMSVITTLHNNCNFFDK